MEEIYNDIGNDVLVTENNRLKRVDIIKKQTFDDRIQEHIKYYDSETSTYVLPKQVNGIHGCMNCPWIDTLECPDLDDDGTTKIPSEKICRKKLNWLRLFSRKPSYKNYAEWHRDYCLGMADKEMLSNYNRLNRLAIERKIAYDNKEMERYELLSKEIKECEGKWSSLLELGIKYDDKQVERDTPKQLEVKNIRTMNLTSMNNILRGIDNDSVVEADYEDVK